MNQDYFRDETMSAKPAIKLTKPLSMAASRELVRSVTSVRLTQERRETLRQYGELATAAFSAPLPHGVRRAK
ncbi:hypothetical protein PQQ77_25060 [Paraburkholderia strydomiana]|uniref:hypothetical protein n=1 Tax=Paraburkholderia strydomiana TaxID=1245417 RepID=UPI0038B9E009